MSRTAATIAPVHARGLAMAFGLVLAFTQGCDTDSAGVDGEASATDEGRVVDPPFAVEGDASGLLLTWFDEEGTHTATSRDEIPATRRAMVRVDDLSAAPDDRLDPEQMYVADLRAPGDGGSYVVRSLSRAAFEARVAAAAPAPGPAAVAADAEVVIYGASWCHACRSAAAFLRERGVPFVERDVEREPGAREAMLQAANAAGVRTNGIPVIDFRGQIIAGFDQGALEAAIAQSQASPDPI